MATLDSLKQALRKKAETTSSSKKQSLSDEQYDAGFSILQKSGWKTYEEFIIPQLSQLITPLLKSQPHLSVLEIGPGPKSILGYLPSHLRHKISKYTAFEPNELSAEKLENWLCSTSEIESPLPCLDNRPKINRIPFALQDNRESTTNDEEKYDVILFCHSMYGMHPKQKFIERALAMLVKEPQRGVVAVFHRESLDLNGLVCHRTASFPTGIVRVADDDKVLDSFAPFLAGFTMKDVDVDKTIRVDWREVCRALGRREGAHPRHLLFSAHEIMVAFNQHATALRELTTQVPLVIGERTVKNREARLHCPAAIVRPTNIQHVQQCVQWALKHQVGLTIIGGSHSDHCLWPNVVSVDMSAFNQVHILKVEENTREPDSGSGPGPGSGSDSDSNSLVVVETGCNIGDIVRKTMEKGLIVPLGARPSVGAGLWLQGGIGLTSDAIVGAVMVSVDSSQVICVGNVPSQYWPVGAIRPANEIDLLWAIKGAGTNFGIVLSVAFQAYTAPTYSVRNWIDLLHNNLEARHKLRDFDQLITRKLPRHVSADAYVYRDPHDKLHLGVTMFECSTSPSPIETPVHESMDAILGPSGEFKTVDSVGVFDVEMHMTGLHSGLHGSGKTSSFKRCLFLKDIGKGNIADILMAAVETCPSPLCYLHLLQGGGAIGDVAAHATAFGCRDWEFACVITGVWPREQDRTESARIAVQWVYNVARDLLPFSQGAYGADLGLDPRDTALALKAFGLNGQRLALLKDCCDPCNVLAYTYALPKTLPVPASNHPKLIILVTGDHCAGKDYCAEVWVAVFITYIQNNLTARLVSISDATKREYALATGANLNRLLNDRAYKEQHRPALTEFFENQVRQRPQLPEEHFVSVVSEAADVDVLLITGMRDKAPVATFSHLVPESRLLDIRVEVSKEALARRGYQDTRNSDSTANSTSSSSSVLEYCPTLIFHNETIGTEAVKEWAEEHLLPFVHEDLQRLAQMVRKVPDFPRTGIEFRHVLGISQHPHGLNLCTSLLQTRFTGNWSEVDAVVGCEAGGFIFASALASRVDLPLVLVRDASKLPPPVISIVKPSSFISSMTPDSSKQKWIGIEQDVLSKGASVVVVDDVLSTGETLCAVLQLLDKVGINAQNISVMVVAEFPAQRGRELLRKRGFGKVNIQSLLVFGGA